MVATPQWLTRCRSKIAELHPDLHTQDVAELAQALADRPSCRALEPEQAAQLLFRKEPGSKDRGQWAWNEPGDER